ncbi:MAG: alpha-L-fucosidase [Armatimonadota bacterium]
MACTAISACLAAAAFGVVVWPAERVPSKVPTKQQLAWQDLEYGMFCHFSINTFHNMEWSDGTLDPKTFNPSDFDARQWARAAKDAGMKYLIVTAKHHDGFCTWPTAYTDYSVKSSPWRDGKGDVVREVARACRAEGLKFGVYLSPWDRHEPSYKDPKAYDQYYMNQLRELLTKYGPVAEVWMDGAGTEGHVYDWAGYYRLVKSLQPNALTAIAGPSDIRWVGNENGIAPETLHNVVEVGGASYWWPAECDVPIRKNWFWHTDDQDSLKSVDELIEIYHKSVGRGACLLLNVAPDRRGKLPETDVARIKQVWEILKRDYARNLARGKAESASSSESGRHAAKHATDGRPSTWWQAKDGELAAWLEVDLDREVQFNRAVIQEAIQVGQRIENYRLERWNGSRWVEICRGTTVGHKRIERFGTVSARKVRLELKGNEPPTVREFGLYLAESQTSGRS